MTESKNIPMRALIGENCYFEAGTPATVFDDAGKMAGFRFPTTAGRLDGIDDDGWMQVFVFNDAERPERGGEERFFNREQFRSVCRAPKSNAIVGAVRPLVIPGRGA